MYEVAVYVYVAGGDYEGLGVYALHYALKLLQLVAVYAGAEHRGGLVGVCAVAVPAGDAAPGLLHYALGNGVVPVFGEYEHLHVDALLVHPVQYEAGKHHVKHAVYHHSEVIAEEAQHKEQYVDEYCEPAQRMSVFPRG